MCTGMGMGMDTGKIPPLGVAISTTKKCTQVHPPPPPPTTYGGSVPKYTTQPTELNTALLSDSNGVGGR